MSKEKQIEEIRKDIFSAFGGYAKWEEDWQSLAEAVYNAGYRKKNEWISVDERLPTKEDANEHGDVLGITRSDGIARSWTWDWIMRYPKLYTHWMPLPEPPVMKGGAE